jgi:glycosyltransferase involved in cell wall biosynthesis
MKIAFFHELTPLSGARKVVDEYGKIIGKENQVDLYYVDDKEDLQTAKIFNKVHFFKFTISKSRIYRDSVELFRLFLLHKKIAKIIKKNNYDFVFISPSKFTQAPFLLGLVSDAVYFCQEPLRIVYDPLMRIPANINLPKKGYEYLNRRVRKVIDANNLHDAKLVLCNSEFSRNNIYKAYGTNAKVCYLGVDTQKYSPKNVKKIYDLLFIGDKSSIEGNDLLSETLKTFKKKPLVKYISRDSVGQGITEEDLVKELNKSKIVLALSKNEPFGLIPIEAMACGVPVIAVSEGGLKESVIDGVTGYLIKRDKSELKEKIDLLLKNDSLRNKLGKNSRERVLSKFTWDESVERFLAIIKQ